MLGSRWAGLAGRSARGGIVSILGRLPGGRWGEGRGKGGFGARNKKQLMAPSQSDRAHRGEPAL